MAFKCFFKKIGIFIPILAVLLMSHNTLAAEVYTSFTNGRFEMTRSPIGDCNNFSTVYNISYGERVYVCGLNRFVFETDLVGVSGRYLTYNFKINIVGAVKYNYGNTSISIGDWYAIPTASAKILSTSIRTDNNQRYGGNALSTNVTAYYTQWDDNQGTTWATETFVVNGIIDFPTQPQTGHIRVWFGSDNAMYRVTDTSTSAPVYIENADTNYFVVNWSGTSTEAQQSLNALNNINNTLQNNFNYEQQGVQNIQNQTTDNIPDSENQATTNLVGVINNFVTNIGNINATNCQVSLDFPTFAGGSRIVDICQGKEKAPTIITIGSSMLLIGVFIPLAWLLLRMIYSEIRSWTNG